MSRLPQGNPKIPEGINVRNEKPLAEFFQLLVGVLVGFSALVLVIVVVVDVAAPYIPFSWERRAQPMLAGLVSEEGESVDAAAQQALADLGAALVATSVSLDALETRSGSPVPADAYRFHLVSSDMANAFATLGGHIVVTDALVREVQSENGLAMVVAHEIAHIRYRHPIAGASRGLVLQVVLTALLGVSGEGPLGNLLSGSSLLTLLSFNRDMESQADERALAILERHYGTLAGADEFFSAMADTERGSRWLEFAQTHPNAQRRLEVIRRRADLVAGDIALTPMPTSLARLPATTCSADADPANSPAVGCD